MGGIAGNFIKHVVPGVIRPLRSLWNQMVGFLFLVFTVVSVGYVVRAVRDFQGDLESLFRIVLPGCFGLAMGYFAVSSFWRARKISRP